ncbi:hypothetical protein [Streptomyces sp. YIM S03343]
MAVPCGSESSRRAQQWEQWTCVRPVAAVGELSGDGPSLHPATPYLSFGVSGGTAVLWDPQHRAPLKLAASQVWLAPAASGKAPCEVAGKAPGKGRTG